MCYADVLLSILARNVVLPHGAGSANNARAAVVLEQIATRSFRSRDFDACEIAAYRAGLVALGKFEPALASQPIPFAKTN